MMIADLLVLEQRTHIGDNAGDSGGGSR
jgi:hypothetical protein